MSTAMGSGITFPDGSIQTTAMSSYYIYNSTIAANTTYSATSSSTGRIVALYINCSAVQGGNTYINLNFQWGLGSLANTYTPVNSGVNYFVWPCPSFMVYLTPSGSQTIYFRVNTTNLSSWIYTTIFEL